MIKMLEKTLKVLEAFLADLKNLSVAVVRYWLLIVLVFVSFVVMTLTDNLAFIPYGYLKFTAAFTGALILRNVWSNTISSWIGRGGYAEAWSQCSPDTKVKVAVAIPLVLFAGAVICFSFG